MSGKTLVLVESPNKVKKIQTILGSNYIVRGTYGHILDLDPKGMSFNSDSYEPNYVPIIKKNKRAISAKKIISDIKALYKQYGKLLIATDDDREGEMIAWSIEHVIGLKPCTTPRIIFNAVNKEAINTAIKNVTTVNNDIVDAQKTRRILDRIIGYKISPLLFNKFGKYRLSAGRVQSVVTRLIVDLEEEIQKYFDSSDMNNKNGLYKIKSTFNENIIALLYLKNNKSTNTKFTGLPWSNNETKVMDIIQKTKDAIHKVENIFSKKHVNQPSPPYTTCTMQQDATKIGLSIKQSMEIAQKLYEGGYITYMRTDSIKLSNECLDSIKKYVTDTYGQNYYSLNNYPHKENKFSQEAHEAIRPVDINLTSLKNQEDSCANKLYKMIWKRTIMSQMASAEYAEKVYQVSVSNDKEIYYEFSSKVLIFDGFLIVKGVKMSGLEDEENSNINTTSSEQYNFKIGAILELKNIEAKEEFTRPKSRYNEATLVKTMEQIGVGRPSTYEPSVKTILEKEYVVKKNFEGVDKKISIITFTKETDETKKTSETIKLGAENNKLAPTPTGILIVGFLKENFPKIIDYTFTASMENDLDKIASKEKQKNNVLKVFCDDFEANLASVIAKYKIEDKSCIKPDKTDKLQNAKLIGKDDNFEYYVVNNKFGSSVARKSVDNSIQYSHIGTQEEGNSITLEAAIELTKYPINIGIHLDKEITIKKGINGIYAAYDGMNISLNDIKDDVTLEKVIELINAKIEAKKSEIVHEDAKNTYKIIIGKFGPYIQVSKKNVKKSNVVNIKLPSYINIDNLELDRILEIVDTAKAKTGTKATKTTKQNKNVKSKTTKANTKATTKATTKTTATTATKATTKATATTATKATKATTTKATTKVNNDKETLVVPVDKVVPVKKTTKASVPAKTTTEAATKIMTKTSQDAVGIKQENITNKIPTKTTSKIVTKTSQDAVNIKQENVVSKPKTILKVTVKAPANKTNVVTKTTTNKKPVIKTQPVNKQ
jgi:DNA topoisomerase-1